MVRSALALFRSTVRSSVEFDFDFGSVAAFTRSDVPIAAANAAADTVP